MTGWIRHEINPLEELLAVLQQGNILRDKVLCPRNANQKDKKKERSRLRDF